VFAFFQCVTEAVVENGVKGLLDMVPGGTFALADAVKLLDISHEDQIKAVNAFKPVGPKKGGKK
jgi:hypothetical protein